MLFITKCSGAIYCTLNENVYFYNRDKSRHYIINELDSIIK